MEYKKDTSNNIYLEVPLGWDDSLAKLRLTFIKAQKTVRLNKIDKENHVYPGPEFEIEYVPELIEALAKTYNHHKEKE